MLTNMLKTPRLAHVSLIIASVTFLFVGCDRTIDRPAETAMNYAEDIMWREPDIALKVLQSVHSMPNNPKQKARYALLLTQAQSRTDQAITNDSLIRIAISYYDSSSDLLYKAWSHYYWANFYFYSGEEDKALKQFQVAENAALPTRNARLLSYIYDNWGYMMLESAPYEESLHLLLKAETYYKSEKDTVGLVYNYRNLGWVYQRLGRKSQMHDYFNRALRLADHIGRPDLKYLIYYRLSMDAEEDGHYETAMKYINEAQQFANTVTSPDKKDNICSQKAYIFRGLQRYDSAQYYLSQIDTTRMVSRAIYHMEMGTIKEALHDYRAANYHNRLYALCTDSFYTQREKQNVGEAQKRYAYAQYRYENERLKSETRLKNTLIVTFALSTILVVVLAYIIYTRMKRRKDEELRDKTEALAHTKQLLTQTGKELVGERSALQDRELQLSEALGRLQLLQSESEARQAQLKSLRLELSKLQDSAKESTATSDRAKELEQLIAQREAQLSDLEKRIGDLNQGNEPSSASQEEQAEMGTSTTSARENWLQNELLKLKKEKAELQERVLRGNAVVAKLEKLHQLTPAEKRKQRTDLLISANERQELYNAVNCSYDDFECRLRNEFPGLTDDDVFTCCLLRMGLGNADIALLLCSSEEAFKKRIYRLRHDKLREACRVGSLEKFLQSF